MIFNIVRYDGLQLSPEFQRLAVEDPEKLMACCNGVGSETGGFWARLTYHLTPNTIWFLDVTPCSDIHDVDCTYPQHLKNKVEALKHMDAANIRFRENLETWIGMHTRNKFLLYLRLSRAMAYYAILCNDCETSFMEGKTFDED
jgi:hypothetical protein